MDFSKYQKLSRKTAIYPKIGKPFVYPALGLAGESGEVVDKIKKIMRNQKGRVTKEDKLEINKEMGDVLWYLAQIATELGIDLNDVAEKNLEKLQSRLKRGKINSKGDNR